ncbi:MAG: DMT family transporter [Anaerolineae bacterium]|nr:DMT family transporter [Anaerolineae bacterium]
MSRSHIYPILQALLAAVLFGASAPIAKLLLGEIEPIPLAAFLYLGSGIGVLFFKTTLGTSQSGTQMEARIRQPDLVWLAGAVLTGGIAAPILLLFSLRDTAASTASLLLNFEGVATTLIAVLIFKEAVGKRALWAIICVTSATILLSWDTSSGQWNLSLGALGILGACVLWGIDNNLTRNISDKDPLTIVLVKGLGAGSFSLGLTLVLRNPLPVLPTVLGALLLGSLSYGLSIVLFIRAMRALGAARTSALFGTAPLVGVALALVFFRETPNLLFFIALPLMVTATLLLLREQHSHYHIHEAITHEHGHRHDDGHHTHDHPEMVSRKLWHSHPHTHERLAHKHPHLPDMHHRHTHSAE